MQTAAPVCSPMPPCSQKGILSRPFSCCRRTNDEWLPTQPWAYLSGAETRDDYLTRRLGAHYAAMQALNEKLPPDAVVQFLWEPRSYYSRVPAEPDAILDRWPWLLSRHEGDLERIDSRLRSGRPDPNNRESIDSAGSFMDRRVFCLGGSDTVAEAIVKGSATDKNHVIALKLPTVFCPLPEKITRHTIQQ